ncbi:MAG: hypothetical protein Kow0079_09080 [Vicingaceae bacterium]
MEKLTYEEFLALILVYVASADFELDKHEEKFIEHNCSKEAIEKAMEILSGLNDAQIIDLIYSYKPLYFKTDEETDKLLKTIYAVYTSDGKLTINEKEEWLMLKKILK